MKKMNKKGFTLIEMLVVIAIIAILVSIIIPTVTAATNKAACAANAANLRSVMAEVTTNVLMTGAEGTHQEPLSKKTTSPDCPAGKKPTVTVGEDANGNPTISVTYEGVSIEAFANAAAPAAEG